MKKLSLVVVATFAAMSLWAQHKPVLGLKAGVNVADWKVENVDNSSLDSRVGFHVGALAHLHLSDKIGFQPEVLYSTQGAKNAGTDDTYKIDYINVPLMLQYMFNNGFRIEAGPQFGFLISAKDDFNGTEVDSKDDYKKTDVGLGFGLNYLSHSGLGIGARYNLGVGNINNDGVNDINNRVFQASIFYMFDRAHKAKSR
jgi:hypothetical protein